MGQHVFICYSSKDLAQATSVCELLERNGIASWMAHRNIQPGVTWATAIVDAIDAASLMLYQPP
jgi:TIR domain